MRTAPHRARAPFVFAFGVCSRARMYAAASALECPGARASRAQALRRRARRPPPRRSRCRSTRVAA
eukprot:586890-Prymnesium_polylepis.1